MGNHTPRNLPANESQTRRLSASGHLLQPVLAVGGALQHRAGAVPDDAAHPRVSRRRAPQQTRQEPQHHQLAHRPQVGPRDAQGTLLLNSIIKNCFLLLFRSIFGLFPPII